MTDHKRDPEADGPEGARDETDAAADAAAEADADLESELDTGLEGELDEGELEEAEELEAAEELGDADLEPDQGEPAEAAIPGTAPAGRRRVRGQPPARTAAPSVSEMAVKVSDRASALFVIGMVALFAAILLYGMLFGHRGFVSGLLPTPTPAPTASPIVSSPSPSASAVVSASPSASGSPAQSASPATSPAASGSPAAASPSPSPS